MHFVSSELYRPKGVCNDVMLMMWIYCWLGQLASKPEQHRGGGTPISAQEAAPRTRNTEALLLTMYPCALSTAMQPNAPPSSFQGMQSGPGAEYNTFRYSEQSELLGKRNQKHFGAWQPAKLTSIMWGRTAVARSSSSVKVWAQFYRNAYIKAVFCCLKIT